MSAKTVGGSATAVTDLLSGTPAKLPSMNANVRRRRRFDRIWSDSWTIEIGALALCIVCMLAICVMLGALNGRPIPRLPKGLTTNAILAILSTIAKSSLLLVVSSCISQTKWKWYQSRNSLLDTQLFEDASRGPLGALRLLLLYKGLSAACIGALVVVCTLLVDPFVQQILTYSDSLRYQPSDQATINQARSVFPAVAESPDLNVPFAVGQAISSGIWFDGFDPKPVCPTGDCVWSSFPSLGICATCGVPERLPEVDCDYRQNYVATHFAGKSNTSSCNVTFSNSYSAKAQIPLNLFDPRLTGLQEDMADLDLQSGAQGRFRLVGPGYITLPIYKATEDLWTNTVTDNVTIQGVKNPLSAFMALRVVYGPHKALILQADECAINFCVREYNVSVTQGTSRAQLLSVRNLRSFAKVSGQQLLSKNNWCWTSQADDRHYKRDEYLMESDKENLSFCTNNPFLEYKWAKSLKDAFWGALPSRTDFNCTSHDPSNSTWDCSPGEIKTSPAQLQISDYPVLSRMYTDGIGAVLNNMAKSVSLLNMNTNPTIVTGSVGTHVTIIHVRWEWLSLLLTLIWAGIGLLTWTIIDTERHRVPLWKSSVLAFMFHGFEHIHSREYIVPETVSEMESMAREMMVALGKSDTDGRTVFVNGNDLTRDSHGSRSWLSRITRLK